MYYLTPILIVGGFEAFVKCNAYYLTLYFKDSSNTDFISSEVKPKT